MQGDLNVKILQTVTFMLYILVWMTQSTGFRSPTGCTVRTRYINYSEQTSNRAATMLLTLLSLAVMKAIMSTPLCGLETLTLTLFWKEISLTNSHDNNKTCLKKIQNASSCKMWKIAQVSGGLVAND